MEKKIMMPANYNVMNEEEMTYTQGGAAVDAGLAAYTLVFSAYGIVSLVNLCWAIPKTRNWIKEHKEGRGVGDLISDGLDAAFDYMNQSVGNAVIGVYTALNLASWPIVTAIAWITA